MPISEISNFSERKIMFISTPRRLPFKSCKIATTSGMGVGLVRFPPTNGTGSRVVREESVDPPLLPPVDPPARPLIPCTLLSDGCQGHWRRQPCRLVQQERHWAVDRHLD